MCWTIYESGIDPLIYANSQPERGFPKTLNYSFNSKTYTVNTEFKKYDYSQLLIYFPQNMTVNPADGAKLDITFDGNIHNTWKKGTSNE